MPQSQKNRLGRGLDVLLGPPSSESLSQPLSKNLSKNREKNSGAYLLDIEKIFPNPNQPRKAFDKEALQELTRSIKQNGLLQAILVEKSDQGYQIIAGERRWRASGMAGLKKIPALLKSEVKKQDSLVWALAENLQREDLNPIEQAQAFKNIMEQRSWKQEFLAQKLGLSRSSVANSLRLLKLEPEVQALLKDKKLSFSQARELLQIKDPGQQKKLARACVDKKLTVQGIKKQAKKPKNPPSEPVFWIKKTLARLERKYQSPIKLQLSRKAQRGHLSFSFKDEEELRRLLDRLS